MQSFFKEGCDGKSIFFYTQFQLFENSRNMHGTSQNSAWSAGARRKRWEG